MSDRVLAHGPISFPGLAVRGRQTRRAARLPDRSRGKLQARPTGKSYSNIAGWADGGRKIEVEKRGQGAKSLDTSELGAGVEAGRNLQVVIFAECRAY
jgi:hypothetical protein